MKYFVLSTVKFSDKSPTDAEIIKAYTITVENRVKTVKAFKTLEAAQLAAKEVDGNTAVMEVEYAGTGRKKAANPTAGHILKDETVLEAVRFAVSKGTVTAVNIQHNGSDIHRPTANIPLPASPNSSPDASSAEEVVHSPVSLPQAAAAKSKNVAHIVEERAADIVASAARHVGNVAQQVENKADAIAGAAIANVEAPQAAVETPKAAGEVPKAPVMEVPPTQQPAANVLPTPNPEPTPQPVVVVPSKPPKNYRPNLTPNERFNIAALALSFLAPIAFHTFNGMFYAVQVLNATGTTAFLAKVGLTVAAGALGSQIAITAAVFLVTMLNIYAAKTLVLGAKSLINKIATRLKMSDKERFDTDVAADRVNLIKTVEAVVPEGERAEVIKVLNEHLAKVPQEEPLFDATGKQTNSPAYDRHKALEDEARVTSQLRDIPNNRPQALKDLLAKNDKSRGITYPS